MQDVVHMLGGFRPMVGDPAEFLEPRIPGAIIRARRNIGAILRDEGEQMIGVGFPEPAVGLGSESKTARCSTNTPPSW